MLAAQYESPAAFGVLGEYRLLGAVGTGHGEGALLGSTSEWLQFCKDSTTHGGIAMRWPAGTNPDW